jgi:hypothetical protein
LGQFGGDQRLRAIYAGMVRYLDRVMARADDLPGRFWYYYDQSRTDWDPTRVGKIDYYHQMQQVEMHALAEQASPVPRQAAMVRDAADHVVALHTSRGVVPYTNDPRLFRGKIHLWGLCSVAAGLLEAAVLLDDRRAAYRQVAREVLDWMLRHGFNGQHFEAVLRPDGSRPPRQPYMVRSDAWVFNALAAAAKHLGPGTWHAVANVCYQKMQAVDFSGPESHASTRLAGLVSWLYHRLPRSRHGERAAACSNQRGQ